MGVGGGWIERERAKEGGWKWGCYIAIAQRCTGHVGGPFEGVWATVQSHGCASVGRLARRCPHALWVFELIRPSGVFGIGPWGGDGVIDMLHPIGHPGRPRIPGPGSVGRPRSARSTLCHAVQGPRWHVCATQTTPGGSGVVPDHPLARTRFRSPLYEIDSRAQATGPCRTRGWMVQSLSPPIGSMVNAIGHCDHAPRRIQLHPLAAWPAVYPSHRTRHRLSRPCSSRFMSTLAPSESIFLMRTPTQTQTRCRCVPFPTQLCSSLIESAPLLTIGRSAR